ncbi:hypothetical protein BDV36DRAFT_288016 [Aspergillus pseudocaelatus]|uniref:Uncharacterized protein n=1 Tax=Aspergillus pseudocaelatus TaxID=1825620 RepID=A0ABQ6W566_9EURO|nr:hypothetical protein BDV36DRAFT_288016 [Aspergillus pseudocaelatus]
MKKTQQEYGFDHTGIFIGKVVNTDKKFQLDFDGKLYHLRADLQSSGQKPWYKAWVQAIRWDPQPTEKIVKLLHLKEVSGQWEEKVKHANVAVIITATNGKANETIAKNMSRLLRRHCRSTGRVELRIE